MNACMKSPGIGCCLIAFACLLSIPFARAAGHMPLSDPHGNWNVENQFTDEFDQTGLAADKWISEVPSWGPWSWKSSNVSVNGGVLKLTMNYSRGSSGRGDQYYSSGIIRSKPTILYGYFEARIRAPARFPGVSPGFWASPSVKSDNLWTEVDFVELIQHQENLSEVDLNTHVFKYPTAIASHYPYRERRPWQAPWDPRDAFHVYGCDWNAKQITWYVDGVKVASRVNDYWHQPLNISLSLGLRPPLKDAPTAEGFPTVMQVDYVRVWSRPRQ